MSDGGTPNKITSIPLCDTRAVVCNINFLANYSEAELEDEIKRRMAGRNQVSKLIIVSDKSNARKCD